MATNPYIPNEATLISYLYGELSPDEREKVEAYLHQHPEAREEMEEMQSIRSFFSEEKEETDTPPLVIQLTPQPKTVAFPRWSKWAAAAVVALLLGNGAINLFGNKNMDTPSYAAAAQDSLMLDRMNQLAARQDSMFQNMQRVQQGSEQQFSALEHMISESRQVKATLSEAQMADLREGLLAENSQLLTSLIQQAREDQFQTTQAMLEELALYMDDQRTQDLELMAIALREVWTRQDAQQEETEILLSQLIDEVSRNAYASP